VYASMRSKVIGGAEKTIILLRLVKKGNHADVLQHIRASEHAVGKWLRHVRQGIVQIILDELIERSSMVCRVRNGVCPGEWDGGC